MHVSRRNFLRTMGIGAAVAAPWPLTSKSLAAFEPTREKHPGGPILLNSNENAYGPPPKAAAVMRSALAYANRYPYMDYDGLAARIASFHRVKPEQVLLGCGSTEILRMAAMAFLESGKQMVEASPTFEALGQYARSIGAGVVSVPLDQMFAHDLEAMLNRVASSTTLVYLCNPNNPTGSITPRKDLETFISKLPTTCHVLMDEAYHHFAGASMYASFIDHPVNDERMIVARTFSKIYGMAGLRLGYAIAAPAVVQRMGAFATFDSINAIVDRAATAALDDTASTQAAIKRNADDRQEFFNQAISRMLRPIDSHANFVMMNTHHPVQEVIEHFRQHNILIGRRFPPMDTYIRVSLGTPSEMRAFWRVWDLLPFARMH